MGHTKSKTKEQDRMEAAILLGGMIAETPHLLFGVSKMLDSLWFVELPRGIRKRAKNLVARLERANPSAKPAGKTAPSSAALFDMRSKVPASVISTPPPAKITMAPDEPLPLFVCAGGCGATGAGMGLGPVWFCSDCASIATDMKAVVRS